MRNPRDEELATCRLIIPTGEKGQLSSGTWTEMCERAVVTRQIQNLLVSH